MNRQLITRLPRPLNRKSAPRSSRSRRPWSVVHQYCSVQVLSESWRNATDRTYASHQQPFMKRLQDQRERLFTGAAHRSRATYRAGLPLPRGCEAVQIRATQVEKSLVRTFCVNRRNRESSTSPSKSESRTPKAVRSGPSCGREELTRGPPSSHQSCGCHLSQGSLSPHALCEETYPFDQEHVAPAVPRQCLEDEGMVPWSSRRRKVVPLVCSADDHLGAHTVNSAGSLLH